MVVLQVPIEGHEMDDYPNVLGKREVTKNAETQTSNNEQQSTKKSKVELT